MSRRDDGNDNSTMSHEKHKSGGAFEDAGNGKMEKLAADGAPDDRFDFVYWAVFFVGLVILLPWNILITVSGYWDYKLRNVTLDEDIASGAINGSIPQTDLQKEFASYVAIAANVPNAVSVIIHALWGHKFGMKLRILTSQVGQIIVFCVIIALAGVDSDSWQNTFLIVNLTTIAFINVFSAVFQGSFCANLGKFPVRYLGNTTNGAGMGGLLPSVVNVIILAVNGDVQTAGFFCFLFAGFMAAACLVLTVYLDKRNEFYQYYSATYDPSSQHSGLKGDVEAYKHVFTHAWVYILATLINFTTTLIAFPAVTVLVRPMSTESSTWNDTLFVPVLCFVLYNLGDYVGKTAASLVQWPKTSTKEQFLLLALSIVRIAFIPLFMYCNVSPGNRDTAIVFDSDVYYIVFMIFFSISNGYVGTIAMMFGPKVVDPKYQEMTAAFLIAFLVLGCGLGSIISAPVVQSL